MKYANKKLNINKDIEDFVVNSNFSIRKAINFYGKNNGLPLIVVNQNNEFVGTLSNGDIRMYLTNKKNSLNDFVDNAVNKRSKFCFETDDKSVYQHLLYDENIRIVPIIDIYKKVKSIAYFSEINFKIKKRNINSSNSYVYLIAEIGVNHNGNIKDAEKLIDSISKAGFDAVKMQFRSDKTYYRSKNTYDLDLSTEYILTELERVSLSEVDEKKIINFIKSKKLDFIGTAFDEESLERLIEYKPDVLKIASCDLTNSILIKKCIKYNLPLILSTGMSTETEILNANRLLDEKNVNRCFLHCNSTYPCPPEDVNLAYINRLGLITKTIAGYSSHDGDKIIPLASISCGARIVELHVTLDKEAKGTDHKASLHISELKSFVRAARKISISIGNSNPRIISQGELMNKIPLGKSLCYSKNLKKGHILNETEDLIGCSPGDGLPINISNTFDKKILKKNVLELQKVEINDFEENLDLEQLLNLETNNGLNTFSREVLSNYIWGVPVRYRDINNLNKNFKPPLLEIHLSSKDIDFNLSCLETNELKNKYLVVHAIEQYHDGFILDLASELEEIRIENIKKLDNFFKHCDQIKDLLKPRSPIKIILNCGGFSRNGFLESKLLKIKKEILYENLLLLKDKYDEYELLPQTMPPFPWHQGGRAFHNLLRSYDDIKDLKEKTDLNICLDFSHTFMECNYSNSSFDETIKKMIEYSNHLHLSDSNSTSDEGLNIDDGNIDFSKLIKHIFSKPNNKSLSFIPEVWQGHQKNGMGFKISLDRIARHLNNI